MNVLLKEISTISEVFTKTDSLSSDLYSSNMNKQVSTDTSSNPTTSSNNNASSSTITTTTSVLKDLKKENNSNVNNEVETYCICKKTFDSDEDDMMIECDACKNWFHGKCVGTNQRLAADIEIYVCPGCQTDDKKIIYKKRFNNHRHDYSDQNAQKKPIQAGTAAFCEQLLKRKFPDAFENGLICKLDHGSDLTLDYLDKHSFKRPILVPNKHELGLVAPSSDEIDLSKIEDIVGADYVIDVIDVEKQEVYQMSINELNTYFKAQPRVKVYNLISFEISKTELTKNITAPRIVVELSWASNGIWPIADEEPNPNTANTKPELSLVTETPKSIKNYIAKPEVHKYCLISAANSYTDFHVDFGGSSVWYHTVKGDKVFYLIEPTEENLNIYEKWSLSKNHSEVFLGDKVKNCYKFEMKEGNTIFLPTGWIHAVFTPRDSLVFGGNFLHSYNIPLQLKVYEIELRLKTPEKYRFPAFETLQWYAARYYTQKLKELNSERKCIKLNLFHGIKHLKDTLKRWLNSKDYYELHDYQVPQRINSEKLVNVMNRELNKAELLLKSSGAYASENSLKLKLKINSDGQLVNANTLTQTTSSINDLAKHAGILDDKPKKTKAKEVLVFSQQQDITEIKVDNELVANTEISKPSESNEVKPLKLKLKLNSDNNNVSLYSVSKVEVAPIVAENTNKIDSEYESDENDKANEDDELINELKNSYQDDDYIYPSLNIGTTARTAKKNSIQHPKSDETPEKSIRKRKLKPHAVQYLQPKTVDKETIQEPDQSSSQENQTKKPIDLLIEKNLNASISKAENESNKKRNENDTDYVNDEIEEENDEEDDDYDYDQDFKMKCQQNLKLSKKLKKSSVKHQKDLLNGEEGNAKKYKTNGVNNVTPSAIGASSMPTKGRNANKKFKKGFATSKQRLGKLLKINRIVNI